MPPGTRRIGEILIEIGALTNELLEEALQAQAKGGERLGRILVDRRLVTPEALEVALAVQRGEREPERYAGREADATAPDWLAVAGEPAGPDPYVALTEAARTLDAGLPAAAGAAAYAALVRAAVDAGRFGLEEFLQCLGVERGAHA